jgi:NAD+ kinase
VTRRVLLVTHTGRPEAVVAAQEMSSGLRAAGLRVAVLPDEADALDGDGVVVADGDEPAAGCEMVVVLGGDGTILGHVGFLAESERDDIALTAQRVVDRDYDVEERMTLDITIRRGSEVLHRCWALNEATVEKAARERMLEVVVEVDDRPLSRFGADGVVMATPTGSTAYSFSAGGPVVWPEVEALLLVPISAHALFARPLVVGPSSRLAVEVQSNTEGTGVLWCDGRRRYELLPGARIEAVRSDLPVRLARLTKGPFTDRLVAKFRLPVSGWRGQGDGIA